MSGQHLLCVCMCKNMLLAVREVFTPAVNRRLKRSCRLTILHCRDS